MALGISTRTSTTVTPTPGTTGPPDPNSTSTRSDMSQGRIPDNNPNGPQPLVPAFILSALMVVGIMTMCWWKRLAMRRAQAAGAGVGPLPSGMGVRYGRGGEMVISTGRGLSAGMVMLAARGADLATQIQTDVQTQEGGRRRKKEIKLGPRPVMWDVYLDLDKEKETDTEEKVEDGDTGWKWMKPLSASPICNQPVISANPWTDSSPNPVATSESLQRQDIGTTSISRREGSISNLPTPLPTQLRISMLISMPSPRRSPRPSLEHFCGSGQPTSPGSRGLSSGLSSTSNDNGGEGERVGQHVESEWQLSGDNVESGNLGECDVVLGVAEVPLRGEDGVS